MFVFGGKREPSLARPLGLGASLIRGCLRGSSGFVSWQQWQPQRLLEQALIMDGPLTAPWLPQIHWFSGSPDVEMPNSTCCVESRSQCLVVSLQFPWMAESGVRLFPAWLFSRSFQQMLLGERWSLFLLAAGLVMLKLGSSFPGFGTADEPNSLDLTWSCVGLLPNCCSRAVLELAQSLPQGRAVPSPRNVPVENSEPLEFLLRKRKNARPNVPGFGSRWNSVPKGKPWVCEGCCRAGPRAAGAVAAGSSGRCRVCRSCWGRSCWCSCSLRVARLLQVPPLSLPTPWLGHPSGVVGETQLQVCSGNVGNGMKRCSCLELPRFGWQTQSVTKLTEQQR